MKYFILLLAFAVTGCGILPPPTESNLSKNTYSDRGSSHNDANVSSVSVNDTNDTGTTTTTTTPPVIVDTTPKPPVIDLPSSCNKSHKGKCKNDNFKNGHYKDKKKHNKHKNKHKHTKHGRDKKK
jgi:hypothetical protein